MKGGARRLKSTCQPRTIAVREFPTRKKLVAALPQRAIVAEIGVERGDFSRSILRKARPRRLHLIDCWEKHHAGLNYPHDGFDNSQPDHDENYSYVLRRFAAEIGSGQIVVHRGYSLPALCGFPDAYFDWIYIDANHAYDAVAAELSAALPKVKPGGVIAGHDYINTPYWKNRNYGVVEAVHDFCAAHGWELVAKSSGPGWDVDRKENPSFAIRQAGLAPVWRAWKSWFPFSIGRAA
jgi:hypothetical protein